MPTSLIVPYIQPEEDTTGDIWLNMAQVEIPEIYNAVNLYDLTQMFTRVTSGLSVRTYRPARCPVTIQGETVIVPIEFDVFPSSMDMPYSLRSGLGELSGPSRSADPRQEFDIVVPMTDRVTLPFLAENLISYWQTPCFNEFGEQVFSVGRSRDGATISLDRTCFGVLRVICDAIGYRHTCTMEFIKGNYSITNVKNSVVASWVDENNEQQTATLDLELPGCVEDLLETCDDGSLPTTIGQTEEDPAGIPTVYYSTCNGFVILLRYE